MVAVNLSRRLQRFICDYPKMDRDPLRSIWRRVVVVVLQLVRKGEHSDSTSVRLLSLDPSSEVLPGLNKTADFAVFWALNWWWQSDLGGGTNDWLVDPHMVYFWTVDATLRIYSSTGWTGGSLGLCVGLSISMPEILLLEEEGEYH